MLDERKETAAEAAKCRDPVSKNLLRKVARRARREFEACRAVLLGGKVIHRPVVAKLWINGMCQRRPRRVDRGVGARCENATTTKMKTSEVQTDRIRHQRSRGDSVASQRPAHADHRRERRAPEAWEILRFCASQEARRQAREGTSQIPCNRSSERISKWYTTALVDLLVRGSRDKIFNCEHMLGITSPR